MVHVTILAPLMCRAYPVFDRTRYETAVQIAYNHKKILMDADKEY